MKTYRDFMPEADRLLAVENPGYAEAWSKTFAGTHARLEAACHNLAAAFRDAFRRNPS